MSKINAGFWRECSNRIVSDPCTISFSWWYGMKIGIGAHIRAWRNDSLAAAGSASPVAWAITAPAFGFQSIIIGYGAAAGTGEPKHEGSAVPAASSMV
ncbi:hypothetical protein SADUNF_Sadunf08G0142900 [Salix dunnii]|uniref:Uncharacterized protein n=1 Tax=Salix dunnii TaxID=1413687 RepID=A0A835JYT2_9ROSI|nr:hypothetical protein SADUNF_Sadunf08G0142900 [Salix dunnii]